MLRRLAAFIRRHWAGENPPLTAVLVGGVIAPGIALALVTLAWVFASEASDDLRVVAILGLARAALSAPVMLWAATGIVRTFWRQGPSKGAVALLALAAITAVTGLLRGPAWAAAAREHGELALGRDTMGAPAEMSVDQGELLIEGALAAGSAERLQALLRANKGLTIIALDSPGGRILEADKMAVMIRAAGLDTMVVGECLSACTTLLLAGRERCALLNASVGFHQATADGNDHWDDAVISDGLEEELVAAGVSAKFASKAASTASSDMWIPKQAELIEANVLTHGHDDKPGN